MNTLLRLFVKKSQVAIKLNLIHTDALLPEPPARIGRKSIYLKSEDPALQKPLRRKIRILPTEEYKDCVFSRALLPSISARGIRRSTFQALISGRAPAGSKLMINQLNYINNYEYGGDERSTAAPLMFPYSYTQPS